MKFEEAIKHLKLGENIKRYSWNGYLFSYKGSIEFIEIHNNEKYRRKWEPQISDFLSDDWKVIYTA